MSCSTKRCDVCRARSTTVRKERIRAKIRMEKTQSIAVVNTQRTERKSVIKNEIEKEKKKEKGVTEKRYSN
jgi:hypothetical protein